MHAGQVLIERRRRCWRGAFATPSLQVQHMASELKAPAENLVPGVGNGAQMHEVSCRTNSPQATFFLKGRPSFLKYTGRNLRPSYPWPMAIKRLNFQLQKGPQTLLNCI